MCGEVAYIYELTATGGQRNDRLVSCRIINKIN